MTRRLPLTVALLTAVASLAACASVPVEPTSSVAFTKETVLATQPVVDSADVQAATVAFPAAGNEALTAKLQPGVVFAGSASDSFAKNPEGFIRKVTAVRNVAGVVTVDTTLASLDDLVETGEVDIHADTVDFGAGKPSVGTQGLSVRGYELPADINSYKFKYVVDPKVLASFSESKPLGGVGSGSVDINGRVELVGAHFAFNPSIDYKFNKNGLDSSIGVTVAGKLNAGVGLKASIAASAQYTFDKTYSKDFGAVSSDIYTSPPASLPEVKIGGILKIRPTAQLKLNLKCERLVAYGAASVEAGATASADASFTATVSRNGIDTKFNKDYSFNPYWDWNAQAEFSAKCSITGEVSVNASGSALWGAVKGNAEANVTINAGIDGDASVHAGKNASPDACASFNGFLTAKGHVAGSVKVPFISNISKSKDFNLCDLKFSKSGGSCSGSSDLTTDSCTGKEDGVFCSNIADYAAFECKGGALQAIRYCADVNASCTGGAGQPATADGDYAVKCE